ncbi:MAG: hypothetical protein IPQ07_33005 [Myxococcales bacterium]|nr:hypothetical protein [Myxococcales bacterium]
MADAATVAGGERATAVDVLANDTDIDGGPKMIGSASDPTNGTVMVAADGLSLTYQPDAGYCNSYAGGTPDTFTYTLSPLNTMMPATSTTTVSMTVTCSADLSITMTDAPDPVTPGGALTYTINVTNNGPTSAEGTTVTLPMPAGASLTSAIGTGWACSGTTTVTCTRASLLAVGAAPVLTVIITAPASGVSVSATATASATTTDPVPGNDAATATTQMQQPQTITYTSMAPTPGVFGTTYTVTATATSGLPVTFSTIATTCSGFPCCTVVGSTVSFTSGTGACIVRADQAGNASYAAAPMVPQWIDLGKAAQTISFNSSTPAAAKVAGATYTVTASSTASLTVGFTIDPTAAGVCTIAGSTVSFLAAGACVINANQAGDGRYNAAPQAQQSFTVGKGDQTISFISTAPGTAKVGGLRTR